MVLDFVDLEREDDIVGQVVEIMREGVGQGYDG